MASNTDIANFALTKLGHAVITNMVTDDSDEALAVNAVYEICRDEVLAQHPWNFATEWHALPTLAGAPDNPAYDAQYQLPKGTLRVWGLDTTGWSWVVEGTALLTNLTSPSAQVTIRVTDSGLFSAGFTLTLGYRLAAELCNTLTARRGNASDYWEAYRMALQDAKTRDGQEGSPLLEDDNPLADARLVGTDWLDSGTLF